MKMAVVGCEASGKTVFMCALADYFGRDAANNPARVKMTPENAAANSFERFQFRQMRCMRQWPPATPPDRTIEIKWSLRHEGNMVAEMDMLEFGGETFRAAFQDAGNSTQHEASVEELLKYLADADFFVVLVSIKALLANPYVITQDDFDRETEALWVTRGILEFIREKRPNAGVVIGLTQADKYRQELGEAGGPRQFFAAHWPTVASAAEGVPVVEVASVSKTDEFGNPAEDYHTHGILPVMRIFAKHCFGNADALENGAAITGGGPKKKAIRLAIALAAVFALAATAVPLVLNTPLLKKQKDAPKTVAAPVATVVEKVVTNTVQQIIDRPVTNVVKQVVEVEKVVEIEKQITNTVETIVEKPVTNTIETVVEIERLVDHPITNTIEKIVEVETIIEKPVTNNIETIVEVEKLIEVEKPVTNTVETIVEVEKIVEKPVTNTVETIVEVEKIVEKQITNTIEKIVAIDRPVTNTVEKLVEVEKIVQVEKPVTNTVEKLVEVERIVEKPVTNTIEKIVAIDRPITNTIEKIVEVERVVERPITNRIETVVEVEKIVDRPVTNTVEKLVEVEKIVQVEKPVTNTVETIVEVEKVVEKPITNTVEKVVEKLVEKVVVRPVTNTVETVVEVEKIVDRPVTNFVEKLVERVVVQPITNTVERVVERVVTNVVERVVERPVPANQPLVNAPATTTVSAPNAPLPTQAPANEEDILKQLPPGYRIWTDYNGRKIIAKWTGVAVDESGITIVTRYDRRIDAVLWKFSPEDQAYIKSEIKRHADRGEVMSNGQWIKNPLLKGKK